LIFDHSEQQIVILITLCWLQKIRERLAVTKQKSYVLNMGMFNLKKLNDAEDKEKCRVEIAYSFAA
jgi:hypothetical protein